MTAAERLRQLSGLSAATAAAMLLAIGSGATAGELLVSSSPLSSATAAEHLLAERAQGADRMDVSSYINAWTYRDTIPNASPTAGYLAIGRRLSRRR